MKRIWILVSLMAVMVWTVGPALAQSDTAPPGQAQTSPQTQSQTPTSPEPQAAPQSPAPATPDAGVKAEASAGATVIMEKAKKVPPQEAEATEKKLRETVKKVEEEAASKGDQTVASRLGAEFGLTPDALIAEKGQYQTGWGELMIAHTILASAKSTVTLDQLFEMRRNGLGWGQIGHGLDLRLGGIVSAVKAESRVALGAAKADGRPAKIQSAARANAGTKVGAAAGHKGTGVSTDVGVGADAAVKGQAGK